MQKTALLIGLLLFLFAGFRTAFAQEFDFKKAYQDYVYSQTVYDKAYSDYQNSKNFYLKNPTLTLKEDARVKTSAMLRARDELMRVYFTALRLKLVEDKGLAQAEKEAILAKIDAEVAWYQAHKETYRDSDLLEDLFNKSKETETRYKTGTTLTSYEALFDIGLGEEIALRKANEKMFETIKGFIEDAVNRGAVKIDPFNRWFGDIEKTSYALTLNEEKGRAEIQKIYSERYLQQKIYESAIAILGASVGPLKQLNTFLIELLAAFKSQLM